MDSGREEKLIRDLHLGGLSGKVRQMGCSAHVEIWVRHRFKCAYCGEDLLKDVVRLQSAQLDHLLPKNEYPAFKDEQENLVLACFACNQWKRTFDPLDHVRALKEKVMAGKATPGDLVIYREDLIRICWEKHLKRNFEERKKDLDRWNSIILASTNQTDI